MTAVSGEADGVIYNQAWSLAEIENQRRFSIEDVETAQVTWPHTDGWKCEDASEEALLSFVYGAVDKCRSETVPTTRV